MEIYKEDCIQYVVILENNEGFYPPEVTKLPGDESKKEQ